MSAPARPRPVAAAGADVSTEVSTDVSTDVSPDAGTDLADQLGRRLGVDAGSDASLRRYLHGLPGVDQVGLEVRAAGLGARSIKTTAKAWALDTAISMVDLTTLEGADTPGKVQALCAKAMHPDRGDPAGPRVAAVCVCNDLAGVAKEALAGTDINVAAVATAFPSGRAGRAVK